MTVADSMRFQHDELTVAGRNIVPLLREVEIADPAVAELRDRLLDWDYVMDKDSVAAAIYATFERRLRDNVHATVVPEAAQGFIRSVNNKRLIDWLVAPDGRFGDRPVEGRDALLRDSLAETLASLTERLGPDMTTWHYGQVDYKHALIRHPMTAAVSPDVRRRIDVGPLPRGGYSGTVHNTGGGTITGKGERRVISSRSRALAVTPPPNTKPFTRYLAAISTSFADTTSTTDS